MQVNVLLFGPLLITATNYNIVEMCMFHIHRASEAYCERAYNT